MKLKNTVIAFSIMTIVLGVVLSHAPSANAVRKSSGKSKAVREGLECYKAIVDNNLFRPLGWGKKKPEAPFVLKSTMSSTNIPRESKAIIWVRASKKERVVAIGDKIGGAVVKMITDEEVNLQKGEKRIELSLGGAVFLNAPRGGKGRSSSKRKKKK